VEEGEGTELGEIENVKRRLDSLHAVDETCKVAFMACFPTVKGLGHGGNTKTEIKKNLRKFSGYVKGTKKECGEKATEKLSKYHADALKHVCQLFDVSDNGTKAKLIERIIEFCEKPKSSGHSYKGGNAASSAGTKRKTTSSSKKESKKDSKSGKPKRALTSFMLFSNDKRQSVIDANPDIKFNELGQKIGELWRNLSDSKKAVWKAKAEALKGGADADSEVVSDAGSASEAEDKPAAKKAKKEPVVGEKKLTAAQSKKITAAIEKIVKGADLDQLSVKSVKVKLAEDFGQDMIDASSQPIKAIITDIVAELSKPSVKSAE